MLVFTGDLADKAEPAAYARLRELVEPVAADLGAQVVWVMGNHDERAPFARSLFGSDDDGSQDRAYDVAGLRVLALDTSVPGYHHGDLTDDQLGWLADHLATPAPHGTLLAMHHPPIPVPMLRAAEIIELLDQHRLADVISRHRRPRDPRRSLPLHVVVDLRRRPGLGRVGQLLHHRPGAARPADLRRRRPPGAHDAAPLRRPGRAHRRPAAGGPEASGFPADVVAQLEALSADERREIISRKDSAFNTGGL